MMVVDHGSLNIALPTIADRLDTDLPTVQWVALGYALGISAFLLPAGRLADVFGRKNIYIWGFILFGLASAAAGAAPNLWTLIFFKVLSAVGSAIIMANGMAILISVFPSNERGKAIGTHMAFVGSGSIFGPALGGILVDSLGWRSVFFVNVPLAVLGVVAAIVILNARRFPQILEENEAGRFDWLGAGLSAGALIMFLLAVTNGGHRIGWLSAPISLSFVAAALLLVLFIRREGRTSAPMLHLDLFKNRTFSLGAVAAFVAFMSTSSIFFLMPFYLQEVLDYVPREAGLIMISSAAAMVITGPISGRFADRFGWKPLTITGAGISAIGMLLLTRLSLNSSLVLVISALVCHGGGGGIFHAANHTSIMTAADPRRFGVASAFINLNRNTASTVGQAIAVAIAVATMASLGFAPRLDVIAEGGTVGMASAFTAGLRNVYYVATGLMLVVLGLAVFQGKRLQPIEVAVPCVDTVACHSRPPKDRG